MSIIIEIVSLKIFYSTILKELLKLNSRAIQQLVLQIRKLQPVHRLNSIDTMAY